MNEGEVWFARMNEGKRYIVVLAAEPEELVVVNDDEVATATKAVQAVAYAQPQVRLMGPNLIGRGVVEVKAKLEGKGPNKKMLARSFGVTEAEDSFYIPADLLDSKLADSVPEAEAIMFSQEGATPMLLPPRTDGYKPEEV